MVLVHGRVACFLIDSKRLGYLPGIDLIAGEGHSFLMSRLVGKCIKNRLYLHVSSLAGADDEVLGAVRRALRLAGLKLQSRFNVVRVDVGRESVALLNYCDFFQNAFPALQESWGVEFTTGGVGHRSYADSLNPPILHRKELFLPDDHPRRAEFATLTEACEVVGLFDQPTRIGYRRQWEQLVREEEYRIVGHQLVPIGNDERGEPGVGEEQTPLHVGWEAARHLTALTRHGFSPPAQSLARYGSLRVFDYGCGRGDDVRGLVENGIGKGDQVSHGGKSPAKSRIANVRD